MSEHAILPGSIVEASEDHISSAIAGEVVILNLRDNVYHGLNPIGGQIWNLLQQSTTVSEIRNHILNQYEVDPDRCERDLLALLQELAAAGLIEVRNEPTA